MIGALVSLTVGTLLSRRRTALLSLLGTLIVVVAAVYRASGPSEAEAAGFTAGLLADFGLAMLLPLVAVIVGTTAIGTEMDDGTIVYLLARPVPRVAIVLVKLAVAWIIVTVLVSVPILLAGIIGGEGGLAGAHAVAAAIGALEYVAVFLALSLVTSRALVVGLAYVIVWEGVVAGLFAGTRIVSVRQHALAFADALGGERVGGTELGLDVALLVAAGVTTLALVLAVRRLERVELRGEVS